MTLAVTLLQIIVIVLCGRALSSLLKRFGQPGVIGEIAAGILLGPSAFGLFAPKAFAYVFPPASIATLQTLSQIGLVLFMFLVGLEFAPELLRERKSAVVVTSSSAYSAQNNTLLVASYGRSFDDSARKAVDFWRRWPD